jgi:hypothetical protein
MRTSIRRTARARSPPAELDAGFTDKIVLLAYEKNGAPLDSSEKGRYVSSLLESSAPRDGYAESCG